MKDRFLLVATGIACSLLAWAFWHYLRGQGFSVLPALFLVVAVADNARLRRELRARRGG
jgi:hypothetical protein